MYIIANKLSYGFVTKTISQERQAGEGTDGLGPFFFFSFFSLCRLDIGNFLLYSVGLLGC